MSTSPAHKFSELGLAEPLLRAVVTAGYEIATPIQAAAIPVVLAGFDLVGCAQTGTGKTAAFTLPMLDRLLTAPTSPAKAPPSERRGARNRPAVRPTRALVLAPTRELAQQIEASLAKYGRHTSLQKACIYGGVSQFHQVKALQRGIDALVATPGRLIDLMDQGYVDLSRVEVLVFDEADQMLDMGFLPALRRIVKHVPAERQTLMFSATMPDAIRALAQEWLTNPQSIEVAPVSTPADRIEQVVHLVDKSRKPDLLSHFLAESDHQRTLVFSRTKHGADKLVKHLTRVGVDADAIHGNKSQSARNRALERFKGHKPPVLVATDIAARGLDIRGVSHVVNYDLPETPETYVHRIGRTARAGAEGVAVSFCSADERDMLRQIERLMKIAIPVAPTVAGFEPTEVAPGGKAAPKKKPRSGTPAQGGGGGGGGGARAGRPGGGGGGGPKKSGGPGARYAGPGARRNKPRKVKGSTGPSSGNAPRRPPSAPAAP